MALSDSHAKNLLDMFLVSESSLAEGRTVPAMVLLYSVVDSMAWVADPTATNLRKRFENWTTRWLLPQMPKSQQSITPTDLYAARCALLHTGTGVSDLFKAGKARRVLYSWGSADVRILEYAIATGAVPNNHVALHCNDLLAATRLAVADFMNAAQADAELSRRLEAAAKLQYTNLPSVGAA